MWWEEALGACFVAHGWVEADLVLLQGHSRSLWLESLLPGWT